MSFDFGVMNKIKILKGNKDDLDIGNGGAVEDVYVDRQPSIEEVLNSNRFSDEDEVKDLQPEAKDSAEVVEDEIEIEHSKDEVNEEIISEPIIESTNYSSTTTTLTTAADSDYLSVIRRRLGIDESEQIEVYSPGVLSAKPLDFKEIKDTKGLISAKVSKFELESGLSCMPFSLVGLNKNIVEIKDYHISTVGNEKYVSSSTRISNKHKVSEYVDRWKSMVESAEDIEESLMETINYNGKQVKTIAFNQAELDQLLSLFNQVNATLVIHGDDVIFMAGV